MMRCGSGGTATLRPIWSVTVCLALRFIVTFLPEHTSCVKFPEFGVNALPRLSLLDGSATGRTAGRSAPARLYRPRLDILALAGL